MALLPRLCLPAIMQLRLLHLLGALTWSISQASQDTCVEEDQQALLQFMKTRAGDCTNQKWDCNDGGFSAEAALQVISERPDNRCEGSEISLLNITNGAYTPVCRFNTTCFNSCGIGRDDFIYCRIDDAPTNSLVRITCPVSSSGPTTGSFCWLGEVPLSRAGGFNPRQIGDDNVDRFYWITIGGSIDVQFYENASAGGNIGVDGLPGWSTAALAQANNNIGIGSGINIAAQESGLQPAGDLAIRRIEGFPNNQNLDWLISCTEDRVLLQSVSGTTNFFYDLQMVLPVGAAYGLPSGSAGAMWDFSGRIYCAYNSGDGVFEILLDQASTTQVPVVLASPAESIPITAQNDGMNCIREETPFPTTTSTTTTTTPPPSEPCFNELFCPLDGTGPNNGLTMTDGPEIDRLNGNRFSFSRVCQIASGSPQLDSCGINDVDGMIYCVAESGSNVQLVRVTCGSQRATNLVCYLGEVPAVNVNGASFAPGTGTFVARNNSDIFTFENVASLNGSTLPVTTPVTQTSTFSMPVDDESDLIVQEANVDGSRSQSWIFSCYGRSVFARPLDGSGTTIELTITGLAVDADEQARSMWGYNDGSVYCAYVRDGNAFERIVIQVLLDTVNTGAGTVEYFQVAPPQGVALSQVGNEQDGLNCLNTSSPFPGSGGTTTTTTIAPCEAAAFNCSQYPGPLQVINDNSGSNCISRLQYLNSSGVYTPICSSQAGECQQGCSYNPKDGKIYCQSVRSFRNLGRYLTRIDCDGTTGVMKVCYVDLFRNDVRAASFVEEPFTNFSNYVHSSNPLRNLRADVTTLDAFEDPPFDGVVWPGLRSDQISSSNYNSRSMAISRFDIGDGNGVQTWAIGCNDGQVVVQGVSNGTDNFLRFNRYTLTIEEPVPTGGRATTAWTFENKVYCAYDNAVYFLFTEFITLNTVTNTGTIILGEVSNATTVNNNDDNGGLQCSDALDPFPDVTTSTTSTTTLGPLTACSTQAWNCSNSSNFSTLALQVINEREDGLCVRGTIQALDVETGTYTLICTFPDGECFNGCGVSPLDDQIYCFTEERNQDLAYLTRLSCPTTDIGTGAAGDVCYIGLQRASVSANFDRGGQFVFIADAGGLFVQQDLETLPAYGRRPLPEDNVTFDYRPNATQVNANQPNQIDGFDLTVRAIDLGNATGVQNFTISCNENYVSFQSLTNESAFYQLTMTNVNPQGISGAQWEFDGRVFCSYNDEGIVYEILLNTADLQANTIASGIQNPSQVVQSNDGLNCLTAQAPFIDRTTTTTVTTEATTTSAAATTTSAVATTTSAAASTTSKKKPYYRRFRRFHRFRRIRRRHRNRRYLYNKYNSSEQKGDDEE